jgi:hypothetical protein
MGWRWLCEQGEQRRFVLADGLAHGVGERLGGSPDAELLLLHTDLTAHGL